jgi:hopanoid biosynthesis associated protein HpnK
MVGGQAAADAVARARRLPRLRVGLHLVVIEGRATLPQRLIPDLVGHDCQFPSDQAKLGVRYYFSPVARRQLRAEIKAQFAAFAATGLRLDHANAHKHMHLHPTVGRLLIEEGQRYGLPALRVPAEPPDIMAALGQVPSLGDRALFRWTRLLRAQANRAGLRTNDSVFGLGWTGHMTTERLLRLAAVLPPGLSEIYFHPATMADATLSALMPSYEHKAELATLLDPAVAAAFPNRVTYG